MNFTENTTAAHCLLLSRISRSNCFRNKCQLTLNHEAVLSNEDRMIYSTCALWILLTYNRMCVKLFKGSSNVNLVKERQSYFRCILPSLELDVGPIF